MSDELCNAITSLCDGVEDVLAGLQDAFPGGCPKTVAVLTERVKSVREIMDMESEEKE